MIDSFAIERRPAALILGEHSLAGQAVLNRLGSENWLSVVTDFERALDQMSLRVFDVVVIVSRQSELQVLQFARHIRSQSTRTRVATVLAISDEVSPEEAELAGIDRVVGFESGVKDVVLHIAQAATQRVEKSRLRRKENFVL
ncbi:hypothetical protein [Falsihalocynthiibacter arcticus]|uniref:Response regulatory domain-containing protein n=1 Tax=Falsihalocynthiibacter arcticus TaxID=1579316 RepID=A0A126V001_9RHOB|nr:hypothetical protein [Falsihalocynthiibacter arcticus]AML51658.1 hypothetical protein RC74_10650 [Falsihalocynthiibacter arcticus]